MFKKKVKHDEAQLDANDAIAAANEVVETPVVESSVKEVFYQGKKVVSFVGEGDLSDAKHCIMEDGSTMHVPNELF